LQNYQKKCFDGTLKEEKEYKKELKKIDVFIKNIER
jgi:hypothetical protein